MISYPLLHKNPIPENKNLLNFVGLIKEYLWNTASASFMHLFPCTTTNLGLNFPILKSHHFETFTIPPKYKKYLQRGQVISTPDNLWYQITYVQSYLY